MSLIQRLLPPLVLLQWGGILAYFGFSGRLDSFLHPNFQLFATVTGVLLVIAAAIVGFSKEEGCGHEHGEHEHAHDGCCGQDHRHSHEEEVEECHTHGKFRASRWVAYAILIFPFGLAAMTSTDKFSVTLVENRGMTESASSLPGVAERYAEQKKETSLAADEAAKAADLDNPYLKPNAAGNIETEVIDLMYAAEDPVIQKDFAGKRVEVIGQYLSMDRKEGGPNSFKLLRLFMICCATDVQPIAVAVETDQALPEVGSMGWVKVVGVVSFEPMGKKDAAMIRAESVVPVVEPANKYVY